MFSILSLSFIGGIALASFYYPKIIDVFYLYLFLVLALTSVFVFYKNKPVLLAGFCMLVFSLGIYLSSSKLEKINNLVDDRKNISGNFIIQKEPEISGKMQRIKVSPKAKPLASQRLRLRKEYGILITAPTYPEYSYGDEIRLSCTLKIPENKIFDWRMYLAKDNILYECEKSKIEKIGSDKGNKVYSFILKIKNNLNTKISRMIPAPESGLMSGLILGGDDKLSKNIQDNFSRTGMTHIVAVSGYNVTIVAEYLMIIGIFIGLWRRQAFWFAVVGIILFVAMTGFPSSAVRAGMMGILLIWAMKNGRLANSQNAIIFAAVIMLLINPLLLRWDIGFQLSFLATLGIVYMYPVFQNYLTKWTDAMSVPTLLEILFLTLSAQIFVLPVILFNFQKLSLISPLANLLVLPIVPLTMLLGFVAVILSFIFYPLAVVFSWLAYLPLKYETSVINFLASLKYSSTEVNLAWWGVVLWYIILGLGIYFLKREKSIEIK